MWRGEPYFKRYRTPSGSDVLEIVKTDKASGNRVRIVFSTGDESLLWPAEGRRAEVKAWVPFFEKLD
jgi:hypothetical protein